LLVGFVGLGIMGRPMALNLIKGGHKLRVHGCRAESMLPLEQAGATTCASAAEAARGCDAIVTMVADTPDVEQVIFGGLGVAEGAAPGSVVVDMSTISPVATRSMAVRLANMGIEMLDAPVSGGDVDAISGTLSIMVGGSAAVFVMMRPLLELMGKTVTYIGANGAGQVAKACNQIVVAVTLESVAEALTLARRNAVDPGKVRAALLGGFAWSKVLEVHGRRIVERDFKPGFKAKLHHKDLRIVTETAAQLGIALPQSALIAQHLNALVGMGCGDEDSAAVTKVLETLSGLKL